MKILRLRYLTSMLLLVGMFLLLPRQTSATPTYAGILYHGNRSLPQIALTFDDGPSSVYSAQIQAELLSYHAPATFFYIGENVQHFPAIAARAQATGFVIGNHSWDHPMLTSLTPQLIQSQLTRTNQAIQAATGFLPTLMRPPYGAINTAITAQIIQARLLPVLWDVDMRDWTRPGVNTLVQTALTQVHNGAIFLFHDGGGNRSQTVSALAQIIPTLQERGYSFVTVPQMVANLI